MSSHISLPEAKLPTCTSPSLKNEELKEAYNKSNFIKANEGRNFAVIYLGIAIVEDKQLNPGYVVGITAQDGTYSIDYATSHFPIRATPSTTCSHAPSESTSGVNAPATGVSVPVQGQNSVTGLAHFVLSMVDKYRHEKYYKIAGAGITEEAAALCSELPSLLWHSIDVVCLVMKPFTTETRGEPFTSVESQVDEESDSVARKAIEKFGPGNLPRLMVKVRNQVGVDADGHAQLTRLEDYKNSVHVNTWNMTMHFAESLKSNRIKIAFFNTTPQGGGVALMRHALIRFLRLLDVDCRWYVPRPQGEIFRYTKNNHNILQGVDTVSELGAEQIHMLDEWCEQNATRYWTKKGGPFAHRDNGGAHIIVIDDPQMPKLVQIAKQNDPDRPVIFRSHIQVRADLADDETTNTARVWNWVWNHIQKCDVFISHPVPDFVPANVTSEKVGYMPATTDWLDGLNKELDIWDTLHYMHELRMDICSRSEKFVFEWPARRYIVQIARFDPAKGIPDVLASYAILRREYLQNEDAANVPQLVIAGHGAIDDPGAIPIYKETMAAIDTLYPELAKDIIVMRVGPNDQILNVLMRNAHVALQLSTREGFEVKVSEALHAGVPIIATKRGGIPLQVIHERSGYLIDRDSKDETTGRLVARDAQDVAREVACFLYHMFSNAPQYDFYAEFARTHVSDEVSTVGNALCWLYLADTLSKGKPVAPERAWINDMARKLAEDEGVEIDSCTAEEKLPRTASLPLSQ
ncbi:hypothetical protein ACEQ8H_003033 [Pleosporales sp. CAS-2024a]